MKGQTVRITKGENAGTVAIIRQVKQEAGEKLVELYNENGKVWNGQFTYFPASFFTVINNQ